MKTIPLTEYVKEKGQAFAAISLGVHQTAISKAIRTGRNVMVIQQSDGTVIAEELRPFPSQKHNAEQSA